MEVYVNEPRLRALYETLEQQFSELEGKNTSPYAVLKETVIERFLQYGREDIENGQYERAVYVHGCLEKLMEQLRWEVPTDWRPDFRMERPKINGYSFVYEDGKPVFYCGYGHFAQVKRDIPYMNRFGCNTVQVEIGPSFVLYPKGTHQKWGMDGEDVFAGGTRYIYEDGDFEVNLSAVYKDVIPVLERAGEEHVAVCLLLSPHYVPNWMFEAYPGFRSKNVGFLKYNIYHPKAKEMLEVFYRAVLPLVMEYPALQSICISNEPAFNTLADSKGAQTHGHDLLPTAERETAGDGFLPEWQAHLKEQFGDITALNDVFGAQYTAFEEVGMPAEDAGTPLFYTWYLWNNRKFADWHRWMAEQVRKFAPGVPLHAKFMPVFGTSELPYHRRFLHYGVDPEQFAEFTDISGNDAWSFEGKSHLPLSYKLEWYDFLASMKQMPIQNSEDHVIEDRDQNYSPIQAQRIYADMWQGAVHGRSATEIWVWERSNLPQASANGSILHRPDCVEAVGRANLDLNRLAREVAVFQNCARSVAILYSQPSRIYDREYMAELFKAYEGVLYAGCRPRFITEAQIGQLGAYELLVIPAVTHTYEAVLSEICAYLEQGGKALLISRNHAALARDAYDRPANRELLAKILEKAVLLDADGSGNSPNAAHSNRITGQVKRMINQEALVTEISGNPYNIEWCAAEIDGKTLVNVCSYDNIPRKVCLARPARDLISGHAVETELELMPYQPLLLELK